MIIQKNKAFTLVELIVVITIMAILGTIAFLSYQGYSSDSRNGVRLSDLGTMKTSLGLFQVKTGKYPNPSNSQEITYSGGTAWYQGIFGESNFQNVSTLSKVPIDPLTETEYAYSVINNGKKYQLGTITEGILLSNNTNLIQQANAISASNAESYITGDFDLHDVTVKNGGNCYNITIPSLILSEIPVGGILTASGYNFAFDNSSNFPSVYGSNFDTLTSGEVFEIEEILNTCNVDTLYNLNEYIHKLSLNFQQLNGYNEFEELIFKSYTTSYKQKSVLNLQTNGITVDNSVIEQVNTVTPDIYFTDNFTGDNGTALVGDGHYSDTFGEWSGSTSYQINSNKLVKTDISSTYITVSPSPIISSPDTTISFKIIGFNTGDITLFSRYIDTNNYYGLALSSGNYQIYKNVSGTNTSLVTISDGDITAGSTIQFSIIGDNIKLLINGVEKENRIDNSISSLGDISLHMDNLASIDEFDLIYK